MFRKLSLFIITMFSLCVLLPVGAVADLITFDLDSPGAYANPFVSVDSALVSFSEVGSGAAGFIGINSTHNPPGNVLDSSIGGGGPDAILMEFLIPISSLSFDIGHPSGLTNVDGWLQVFNGMTLVSESRVALDNDTLFNQVISYSGSLITSAQYAIVQTGSIDLWVAAESIDNLSFNPVPEPAIMILFGMGLLGLARVSRRKK